MARCFICGNPAVIGSYCKECFRNQNPPVKHFKPLTIKACVECPAISVEGKWIYEPTPDTIPALIRKKVIMNPEYNLKSMIVSSIGNFQESFHPVQYEVKVLVSKGKHDIEQTYEFPLQFEKARCDRSLSAKSTYYEGILQVRGITAVVEEFIDLAIERGKSQGNFLVKKTKMASGYDYYFTKNKFVQKLANELKKQFGGNFKSSSRLVTRDRQTSKELHRVTILYKSPKFFREDLISVGSNVYRIKSTVGKITAINLNNGKSERLSPDAKFTRLIPYTTNVSKISPHLEAIHPSTFQSVPIRNPKPKKNGERVRVVYIDDHSLYLF
ncbi:MAG: hypothetical protein EPN86_04050 [Nanoarchaeota archaeon]|nr:MAG: hypothetical protein EPN86_04050 [Nanoarchaeota archaeon]